MNALTNNETWMKASVAGSLWAAFEIVIGSFLHNLHIPFTGLIMASTGVILLISFSALWDMNDIFWRAGLVCALMKSISPSAVILGPMIGIMLESLLLQFCISIFGQNVIGYITGGVFACISLLIFKVVSMLLSYGFDMIIILENTASFILQNLPVKGLTPISILYLYILILVLSGGSSALFGYYLGKKALTSKNNAFTSFQISDAEIKSYDKSKSHGIWFLLTSVVSVITGLFTISSYNFFTAFCFTLVFIFFACVFYPDGLKPLNKPAVLINFVILILFSAFFFNYNRTGVQWTYSGLIVGLKMLLRAMIVLIGFSIISVELRNPVIKKFLNNKSVIYNAVQTGFSVLPSIIAGLPTVKEMFKRPVHTLSMRISAADNFIKNNIINK
jgi:hypothetical protein